MVHQLPIVEHVSYLLTFTIINIFVYNKSWYSSLIIFFKYVPGSRIFRNMYISKNMYIFKALVSITKKFYLRSSQFLKWKFGGFLLDIGGTFIENFIQLKLMIVKLDDYVYI